jgi:16S rRNA (cytosine967-C5)-methyltransferase
MKARDVVMARVARQVKQFPQLELAALDTSGLEPRDAALANAIDHAVARRWLTLQRVIESQLSRAWEEVEGGVRAALLAGAAQLLLMDRLPDHAVVDEAVEWAKANVRPQAGGIVNAVLRKVGGLRAERTSEFDGTRRDHLPLSEGGAWKLRERVFSADEMTRLGEQTSHPRSVIEHWVMQLGWDGARSLARHNIVMGPVIVTGLGPDQTAAPLGFSAHEAAGFWVSETARADLARLMRGLPHARVQDPGTAAACNLTRDMSPVLIVDVCAGRGTKTKQLCELHPRARAIATDKDAARLRDLRATFAQSTQVEVVAFETLARIRGGADCVVIDVPCSNSGVLARRVEARYRLSEASIAQLVATQRDIVANAAELAGPHGVLLYATCSLEPAENSYQVEWMEKQLGWKPVMAESRFPRGLPGEAMARYADGGFGCLLAR